MVEKPNGPTAKAFAAIAEATHKRLRELESGGAAAKVDFSWGR